MEPQCTVVAIGGNAITRDFEDGNIYQQFTNTRRCLRSLIPLIRAGRRIVLVHGNGPQVGYALIRGEATSKIVPRLPLGITVADIQGGMGYMIQQCLRNLLQKHHQYTEVVTVITQVVVDPLDPSFKNPSKFVGPAHSETEAKVIQQHQGAIYKEDVGRGWRRVVPSPVPLAIVEKHLIRELVENDRIVIAGGGGGIPVYYDREGNLEGLNAVIDKDLTASLLADDVAAAELIILTSVERVALNYRQPEQLLLDRITLSELQSYYQQGQFPPGSMGPKIRSVMNFLQKGGRRALITATDKLEEAWQGKTGTVIVPD